MRPTLLLGLIVVPFFSKPAISQEAPLRRPQLRRPQFEEPSDRPPTGQIEPRPTITSVRVNGRPIAFGSYESYERRPAWKRSTPAAESHARPESSTRFPTTSRNSAAIEASGQQVSPEQTPPITRPVFLQTGHYFGGRPRLQGREQDHAEPERREHRPSFFYRLLSWPLN